MTLIHNLSDLEILKMAGMLIVLESGRPREKRQCGEAWEEWELERLEALHSGPWVCTVVTLYLPRPPPKEPHSQCYHHKGNMDSHDIHLLWTLYRCHYYKLSPKEVLPSYCGNKPNEGRSNETIFLPFLIGASLERKQTQTLLSPAATFITIFLI